MWETEGRGDSAQGRLNNWVGGGAALMLERRGRDKKYIYSGTESARTARDIPTYSTCANYAHTLLHGSIAAPGKAREWLNQLTS